MQLKTKTHFQRLSITEKVSKELQQYHSILCMMGSLADRKTLMRCIEQLEENVMVDQQHRSSERVKAGMFWFQQLL